MLMPFFGHHLELSRTAVRTAALLAAFTPTPLWAAPDAQAASPSERQPVGSPALAQPAATPSLTQITAQPAGAAAAPVGSEAAKAGAASDPGDNESIYVVQQRAYSKRGSLELTPAFFTSLNNKFVGHLGPSLAVTYHMRENLAVELASSIPRLVFGTYSSLVYEVRRLGLQPSAVNLKQMRYFGALALQYSALYGKLDFYDHLIDYDFYVTAGSALVATREMCKPKIEQKEGPPIDDPTCGQSVAGIGYGERIPLDASDEWKIAGSLGGGMRVFFSNTLGLRLEVRDIVYPDRARIEEQTTGLRNNVLLFLGLSVLI